MKQKLVLEKAHFNDHLDWVEEEDQLEVMEEKNEESPWEFAIERGAEQASNDYNWEDDEEWE